LKANQVWGHPIRSIRSPEPNGASGKKEGTARTWGCGRRLLYLWRPTARLGVRLAGAATINYGVFVNTVINFLIVAFAIFMVIKQMNKLKKKVEAAPEAPKAPPREEVLLQEIRDLLKTKS
jgi:hypothetical protein